VDVTAADEATAHSGGLLAAIGVASGQTPTAILIGLRQGGLTVLDLRLIEAAPNPVFPTSQRSLSGSLADIVHASLVADRPGGGCIAALPEFDQGAVALGFPLCCSAGAIDRPPGQ
jgi:hypothetical protein